MARRSARLVAVLVVGLLGCLGCSLASRHGRFEELDDDSPCQCGLQAQNLLPAETGDHATFVNARRDSAQAQNLLPGDTASLCLTLAHKLEREGMDAEAARQYELARHYQPNLDVAHPLAVLYDRLGNPGLAAAEYERAVEAHPKDADLLNDLGYYHYVHGKWTLAEQYLRRAVANNPQHPRAWTNLGMALAQQGRSQESLEAFKHSVSPADAQYNLGFLLAERGKAAEAREAYREALHLKPGFTAAERALAKLDADAPWTGRKEVTALRVPSGGAEPPARPAGAPKVADAPAPAALEVRSIAQPKHATDDLHAAAAALTDGTRPGAGPLPADVPDQVPASHWVIPTSADPAGSKGEPKATTVVVTPEPPASPPSTASGGAPTVPADPDPIRWLPPPPVPQHRLPAELVPCKPAAPHGDDRGAPAPPAAPPMPAGVLLPGAGTSP